MGLPYAGAKGEHIGREINATIKFMLKDKTLVKISYKVKKLGFCFNIKGKNNSNISTILYIDIAVKTVHSRIFAGLQGDYNRGSKGVAYVDLLP